MATLRGLVSKVRMECRYGAPAQEDMEGMDGWTVTLYYRGRQLTVPFYMGTGHNGNEPEARDVLECLLDDASGVEWQSFEGWCGEYGYDTDSRKAERIYRACERLNHKLRRFLGDDYNLWVYAER